MSDNKRDYYEVLGVSKTATEDDIKKAYRGLAKQYHPDLHPNDKVCEEKFKECTEAFEVLSDKSKRDRYDQFGHAGVDPSYGGGGYGGGFGGFSGDVGDIFDSIFGAFGGGGARTSNATAPRRGQDIHTNINISFMEACMGKSAEIKINKMDRCADCGGSGAERGTSPETCSVCHGTGAVKTVQRTPFGAISQSKPCSSCGGKGKIIKATCPKCSGNGRVRIQKSIPLDIPAGIDDGQTISVRSQGDAGVNGGPPGDLNITVSVRPDPIFQRDGYNIHCEVPITFTQAVLGDEITVPTIDGKVRYTIAEGTQTGTVFRLKGKGVKRLNRSERGDQYVKVNIEVPKNLNKRQLDLLKEFESSLNDKNYQKRQSFLERLKDILN